MTLAKELPFTFLNHAPPPRRLPSSASTSSRSRAFHWKPGANSSSSAGKRSRAPSTKPSSYASRFIELALENGAARDREKQILLRDADDALSRVRLIADVVVGAFFATTKEKNREKERTRRLNLDDLLARRAAPEPIKGEAS